MDDADADEGVFSYESSYLECFIELGVAGSHILSVDFPDAPTATADAEHPLLDRVEAYLEGETEEFADVEIALSAATRHSRGAQRRSLRRGGQLRGGGSAGRHGPE